MATLNDLFPGQSGRLRLIRVMLMLRRPELKRIPRDQPLPQDLERELVAALATVRRG